MDFANVRDEELVSMTLENQEVFSHIITRYEKKLSRYIRRLMRASDEDAQDLLQEIFIKTYVNLNDFDTSLKFSSWIYRIAHNQVISHFRKHKVRPSGNSIDVDEIVFAQIRSEIDILGELHQQENKSMVGNCIAELETKYREILVLKFLEHKDYSEISDILKIPSGTVATRINRAKKKLKEKIISTGYTHHE